MKTTYKLYQIDAFTDQLFTGNPAGVVSNADGLSEEEMLRIARELNNSETAFIFTPKGDASDYDVEVRFFTPETEVPICGHATIAAHFVLCLENSIRPGIPVKQKTKAGILPILPIKTPNGFSIEMTQGPIEFSTIAKAEQQAIIAALGLRHEDLLANCPIEIVSTGHSKVMIPLQSVTTLQELKPNLSKLKEISAAIHCNGYFPFHFTSSKEGIVSHGRMFAPAVGINEDPVTGNANGPLGAYLVKHQLVVHNDKEFRFTAKQGEVLKRPGMMEVKVDIVHGKPSKVRISGQAIKVFETTLQL